jgi:hypothetical protein
VEAHQQLQAHPDHAKAQADLAEASKALQQLEAWKMASKKVPLTYQVVSGRRQRIF